MKITEILNWRYSTKVFDPEKKMSEQDFEALKALLRMSPSSTNIQPWYFVVAASDEGKKRVAKGTQGFFQFNEQKVLDASHVVVMCARNNVDETYMKHLLEVEERDGRFPNEEVKQMVYGARNTFADIHRYDLKDLPHWLEKQVYLNMGSLLLGAAVMGIDALPMEGLDMKKLDEEFELRPKGFTAVAVVALGYRKEDDFNIPAATPKSRLPEQEIISVV